MPDSQKNRSALAEPAPARKPLQERAIQTRQELMKAARRVFAQDGFEPARLEDIARAAGKTRGALYAHFRDKEDLFFALIEEDIERDAEIYLRLLGPGSTLEQRIAVVTEQLERLLNDRSRVLLYLEFKMYAIRHPRRQKRLAELHNAICRRGSARKLELIPELRDATDEQRRHTGALIGAVLDGLALNAYFDPQGLDAGDCHTRLEKVVRERLQGRNP